MHYLRFKILFLLFLLELVTNSCFADDTIIIKKYQKPSQALLNKKIIYMDMGAKKQTQTDTQGIGALANPGQSIDRLEHHENSNVSNLNKKSFQVKNLPHKKFKVAKLESKPKLKTLEHESKADNSNQASYLEDDWQDYIQYQDVFIEESLDVNARILNFKREQ